MQPPAAIHQITDASLARRREDRRLFDRYRRSGARDAHEAIVRRFLPLVRHLAGHYRHTSEPFDDLMQVGSLGLLKAIERFDPDRGIAFSSYAVPTITGEIKRHFRDKTWTVRVPRGAQETSQRIGRAERELEESRGRTPTTAEIADVLEISTEAVLDARATTQARIPQSLSYFSADTDSQHQSGLDRYPVEEHGFAAAEDAATLAPLLLSLNAQHREVLRLRFDEDLTQTEIGKHLGYSQMHVSRLIRNALAQLTAAHQAQLNACDHPPRFSRGIAG